MKTCTALLLTIGIAVLLLYQSHNENHPTDTTSRCTTATRGISGGTHTPITVGGIALDAYVDTGATNITAPGCLMRYLQDKGRAKYKGTEAVRIADNTTIWGQHWVSDVSFVVEGKKIVLPRQKIFSMETPLSVLLGHTALAEAGVLVHPAKGLLVFE